MSSMLPPLYAAWMAVALPGPIPEETRATCQQCAMCPPTTGASGPIPMSDYFHPQTKCCTYLPRLPNFLVGRILADETTEMQAGRASVEQRIRKASAATPLGLSPDSSFMLLYRASRGTAFGKSPALRCPHYLEDGGLCGIWRHRDATCTTWFCKYVRGAVGLRFWQMLRQFLATIEENLARWCISQLDLGSEALRLLFPPLPSSDGNTLLKSDEAESAMARQSQRAIWGTWAGREHDFYRASAALVEALTWEEVGTHCGPTFPILLRLTQEAYQALFAETIPHLLRVRPLKEIRLEGRSCQAVTYSGYDPISFPRTLLDALPAFDGRPLEEVRQTLASEQQITLDDALIRKLVDFEVLDTPAAPPT